MRKSCVLALLAMVLSSCASNSFLSDRPLVYGMVFSTGGTPVVGYALYDDGLPLCSTNADGLFSVPVSEAFGSVLVGKKAGFETVRFELSQLKAERVFCVQVRTTMELCMAARQCLLGDDVDGAEHLLLRVNDASLSSAESDMLSALRAVVAFRRGDYKRAAQFVGNMSRTEQAVSMHAMLLQEARAK